ncbi:MAG: GspE/PulE family protein [Candidatus Omnitrophota bacterium]|nr:GspE/PulE family protein [Candidatus Omnitrophota bacterium]
MKFKKNLEQILLEKGKINHKQLSQIVSAREKAGEKIEEFIIREKFVTEEEITEVISEEIGIAFLDLRNFIIDPAVLNIVDEKTARRLHLLPLYKVKDTLTIAMADPQDIISVDEIRVRTGFRNIQVVMSTRTAILEGITQAYTLGSTLDDIIKPITEQGLVYAPSTTVTSHMLTSLAKQPPVIKFVNQMIFDALKSRASDIHIEPLQNKLRIRFRIDGILYDIVSVPMQIHLPVVPRIKILAGLDIAERRKPQDGRFSIEVAGKQIDLRIAVFPMAYGESVSMRILDRTTSFLELEELGFSSDGFKKFQKLIKIPHGIILVTGPTGSGKSSTLYAVLNRISSPEKNILTIEDPIEYLLENVNQAQVNPKIGLDFAAALRSFLRQDPDVIMIGEIRDEETVDMAFRAALTGHLVLSTLHTNDAPTAITRLKDMGLDKNIMASSMLCILAQRLVRTICSSCKISHQPEKNLLDDLDIKPNSETKFYKGKGCDDCNGTGYKGRIGIYELLEVTDEIKILVQKDASIEEIRKQAIAAGMKTLSQDGMDKAKQGITTLEEVIRVTQE